MDFSHYAPHGYCIAWDQKLLWIFVLGNILVAVSYMAIPVGLMMVAKRRRDIKHQGLVGLFAAFIFCCAVTHIIKIWTFWHPDYWLEAIADLITGLVSLSTAITLFKLVPVLVRIPHQDEFEEAERKLSEAERERHRFEALLRKRKIAQSLPIPIWTCDASGDLNFINDRWLEKTGSGLDDNLGRGWAKYIAPDDLEGLSKAWQEAVSSNASEFDYEFRLICKDGSLRRFASHGVRIEDSEDEDNTIWFGCAIDVEDERIFKENLEQLVLERTEDLTALNQELEQFNYVAAHDLREPLRVVRGFSDLLKESSGNELSGESLQFLEFIDQSVTRMQQLIDSLLQLSRLGRTRFDSVRVDTRSCIETALENLHAQIEQQGCRIEVAGEFPPVAGNESQLVQVFQNLISNAVKFTIADTGLVQIDAFEEGEFVVIRVKDNGIGIEDEFKEKIFLPFQRLHSREQYEGSGIGLSIVKKIVDLHRGSIRLESAGEGGCTFFLKLKAFIDQEPQSSVPPPQ
ncbi:MAG: PAS domain-containing protein [Cyanobacteria bacterium HKST-UBA01]|nr:PAS domain-containing protein [Cyanobacteria bacterium HKST-UBA01]